MNNFTFFDVLIIFLITVDYYIVNEPTPILILIIYGLVISSTVGVIQALISKIYVFIVKKFEL